jgi:hypothetical protein
MHNIQALVIPTFAFGNKEEAHLVDRQFQDSALVVHSTPRDLLTTIIKSAAAGATTTHKLTSRRMSYE